MGLSALLHLVALLLYPYAPSTGRYRVKLVPWRNPTNAIGEFWKLEEGMGA